MYFILSPWISNKYIQRISLRLTPLTTITIHRYVLWTIVYVHIYTVTYNNALTVDGQWFVINKFLKKLTVSIHRNICRTNNVLYRQFFDFFGCWSYLKCNTKICSHHHRHALVISTLHAVCGRPVYNCLKTASSLLFHFRHYLLTFDCAKTFSLSNASWNPSVQTHLVLLCCIEHLCIFGPKGAIHYYYYY